METKLIYILTVATKDSIIADAKIVETPEDAKVAYAALFKNHAGDNIIIRKMDYNYFIAQLCANARLAQFICDGTIVNPFEL